MNSRPFAAALAALLLLCQAACADTSPGAPAGSPAAASPDTSADVVFLGDDARIGVLQPCGSDCRSGTSRIATPPVGSSASAVASSAAHAKHAVIVVDATQGPLPITREHIQVARQAGVPSLSVLFVKAAGLDPELLELEEMELRELLNNYEMAGDAAMIFHDVPAAGSTQQAALTELLRVTAALPERQANSAGRATGRNASTVVYLLSPQETNAIATQAFAKGTRARVWVDSQEVDAAVTSTQPVEPGATGELALEFDAAITASAGSRFLVERDGKVIAMGVIVAISP